MESQKDLKTEGTRNVCALSERLKKRNELRPQCPFVCTGTTGIAGGKGGSNDREASRAF